MTQNRTPLKEPFVLSVNALMHMWKYGTQSCNRCGIKLKENDLVIKTKSRHPKYYHNGCYREID